MSTLEESQNDQDPDYASAASNNQTQQKIYEENARNTTAQKITAIVEREFAQEIELKEKEILQIQERLHKSLKALHFLRYVIITDFYNRKQCQLPQAAETSKQTRIHPAVKSLLGKSPKCYPEPAVPSTSTDPRFLPIDEFFKSDTKTDSSSTTIVIPNDRQQQVEEDAEKHNKSATKRKMSEEESRPRKIPRYVPPKSNVPENIMCPSRGERHKVCKRIIVGNISKWIPLDWREDAASHKWTMYVRGDKDNADISTFVSKVRFFLHSSYRPNDVVEVTSYPFHLSRRGWGEFPLRVQLHFRNSLDKPIDIIHHLQLDRTYTGLQTLGSETQVNLWIHTTDYQSKRDQNGNNKVYEVTDNTPGTTKQNDHSELSELSRVKFAESSKRLTSRFIANACEEVQVKNERTGMEMYEQLKSPKDLECTEEHTDVKVKVECDDAPLNNFFTFNEPSEQEILFHIDHDHDYSKKQYSKFYRSIARDGNVTIEHFPDNECSPVTNLSAAGSDEEKSDGAALTSHMCNGDIQSSSDCQPPTNANNAAEDILRAPQVSLGQECEKSNDRQSLLLPNANKVSQNSESNDVLSERSSENASKDALATTNGFCKPSNPSLDRLRNLQRAAGMGNNSHLKPLEISIPPLFSSSTSKRIMLMKDKKLIPVDVTRELAEGDVKVPITSDGLDVNVPQGVSILKKPLAYKVNARPRSGKEAAVLTLKSTNSLLLNANYNVPALKIADSHDLQYNHHLPGVAKDASVAEREAVCPKPEDKDERTAQRTKITLGKDKYKIQSKKELYETVIQSIEKANIGDTESLVRFIIRRLPIVTKNAQDPDYRQLHPYAYSCEEDFFALSVGKQRALEWCRAKMIRGFLQKSQIEAERLWSTKEIIMWARFHGYMPNRNVFGASEMDATRRLSSVSTTAVSTCTEPDAFRVWLQNCQESSHRSNDCNEENEEIDVEMVDKDSCESIIACSKNENDSSSTVNSTLMPLELEEDLIPLHRFVCNTAQDIGIRIGPQEIVPGVVHCSASRVLIRVIECFVEDLTRSSLAKAWDRSNSNECPKTITLDDVRNALVSREEFDIFTNEGLGSCHQLNTD